MRLKLRMLLELQNQRAKLDGLRPNAKDKRDSCRHFRGMLREAQVIGALFFSVISVAL